MSTMWKKTGGVWSVSTAWSKIWKKVSGVWSVLYQRAYYAYKEGVSNLVFTPSCASGTTINLGSDSIVMSAMGESDPTAKWKQCVLTSEYINTIDTPYKTMCVDFQYVTSTSDAWYEMALSFGGIKVTYTTAQARKTISIDVSSIVGLGAINMSSKAYMDGIGVLTVYNVYFIQ
jgi:hypothetical protein